MKILETVCGSDAFYCKICRNISFYCYISLVLVHKQEISFLQKTKYEIRMRGFNMLKIYNVCWKSQLKNVSWFSLVLYSMTRPKFLINNKKTLENKCIRNYKIINKREASHKQNKSKKKKKDVNTPISEKSQLNHLVFRPLKLGIVYEIRNMVNIFSQECIKVNRIRLLIYYFLKNVRKRFECICLSPN